jgi:hypothetical protein
MALIVLAALGVPLWMVVGALAAGIWSRRSFKRAPGVFPAKPRVTAGEVPGLETSWPRRPVHARWVHDVLLVHRGLALVRNAALGAAHVTGPVRSGEPRSIPGLGSSPIVVALILDSGAEVELAGPSAAREAVMTASLGGVPLIARDP